LRQNTDLVQHSQITSRLNVVDDVIQPCGKNGDIFSIEWRNETRIERPHDVMGRLVSYVLQISQLSSKFRPLVGGSIQQLLQDQRCIKRVVGGSGEHVVELRVTGSEAHKLWSPPTAKESRTGSQLIPHALRLAYRERSFPSDHRRADKQRLPA
jgi:hypothetical protein